MEEISATLNQHPFVVTSTVLCHTEEGEPTLVAYCVLSPSADDEQPLVFTALRVYLNGILSAYMIPHYFLILDAMPLTTTGKIDRRALPDSRQVLIHDAPANPKNPTESKLQAIWESVLKQDSIPTTALFLR